MTTPPIRRCVPWVLQSVAVAVILHASGSHEASLDGENFFYSFIGATFLMYAGQLISDGIGIGREKWVDYFLLSIFFS